MAFGSRPSETKRCIVTYRSRDAFVMLSAMYSCPFFFLTDISVQSGRFGPLEMPISSYMRKLRTSVAM